MTWLRRRWLPLLILVPATTALIGSVAVTASRDSGWWPGGVGMTRTRADAASIGTEQARLVAQAWLADHRPGEQAGEAETFPGYYTLHTMREDGKITAMLSVHATTSAVWYHTWHGRYIDMRAPIK